MKLREYANRNSLTYQAAWNQFKAGLITGARQLPTGTITIPDDGIVKKKHNVIYCRESSAENKASLNNQIKRVSDYCAAKGWIVHETVTEIASGLNDDRKKLTKILKERKATRLIVEHKDRLTRFGFNFITTLFPECEIISINAAENNDDLMQDFVSLVTSFCDRLYGRRRTKKATEKLIDQLKNDAVS